MHAQLYAAAISHMAKEPSVTKGGWMCPGNDLNELAKIMTMLQVYLLLGGTYYFHLQGRRVSRSSKQANK
jgi:hypothetical protein